MSEIIKQSMSNIWASAGDIVAPDSVKIADGWLVEVVPRQYWNWMQNRTDTNLAYLFQHGIPEWDATVEYVTNKSYVSYADAVYKAILTGTNQNPTTATTYWKVAFATSTAALEALKETTPAADKLPYYTGATTAATTTITSLARTLLDDTTQAAMLTTIGAQPVDATLTALAGVTTATNKLPYFSGVDTATVTDLSAFGRSLIDDADAATARTTLGLGSAATANVTTSAIDTTAGRLTKVGDFGLGTTAVLYGGDLNLLGNVTGFYRTVVGATNFPNGCLDSCFVHTGSGDTYSQTIIGYNNNRMYTRGGVGVVPNISWQPWREIALTDSPAFTGVPTAPTAAAGTSSTQLATTAFVNAEINADRPYSVTTTDIKMDGVQSLGVLATLPRADHVHPSDTSKLSLSGGTMSGHITFNSNSLVVGNAGGTPRGQLYNDTGGIGFVSTLGQWAARVPQGTNDWAITGTCTAGAFTGPLNGAATTLSGDQSNWASLRSSAVANMLGWKNYGNGHVIFDASAGTAPNGAAINNTTAGSAWTPALPTLMGWNGSTTYGVRVDSARIADSCTDSGWITATLVNGFTHNANSPLLYRKVGNIVYVKGIVDRTTPPATNVVITTLPAGFRPSLGETHLEVWITNADITGALRTISLTTSGDIVVVFAYNVSPVSPSGAGNMAINTSFPV